MAWQDVTIPILRALINDLGATATYTDSRLAQLLSISAQYVQEEVSFNTVYTIDIVSVTITPEPDVPFINLMSLKAACILGRGDQRTSTDKGIMIKDGTSQIDMRQSTTEKRNVADDYCEQYEQAAFQHRIGNAKPGKAVYGPINTLVNGPGTGSTRMFR